MMTSQILHRVVPYTTFCLSCVKRSCTCKTVLPILHSQFIPQCRKEKSEYRQICLRLFHVDSYRYDDRQQYVSDEHSSELTTYDTTLPAENVTEPLQFRLYWLQKQLKCSEEEVLDIFMSTPRLKDLDLFDKMIRNVEILKQHYKFPQVHWLVKKSITVVTQLSNDNLLQLVRCQTNRQKIRSLIRETNLLVKGDAISGTELLCSLLGVEFPNLADQNPFNLNHRISPSYMKEKIDFLRSEKLSPEFLRNFSRILMYSMRRVRREVSYVKDEFGEVDDFIFYQLLSNRIIPQRKSRSFRKSLEIAAKMLVCSKSDFTDLQRRHLLSVFPSVTEESIQHLLKTGFSVDDIRSCIYIIGQPCKNIDRAIEVVLQSYDIDRRDGIKFINAVLYQIKKDGDI